MLISRSVGTSVEFSGVPRARVGGNDLVRAPVFYQDLRVGLIFDPEKKDGQHRSD